jgi:lipid-A-disaccharide synthase
MEKTKKILIVAGEPSGDLHAANLVKAIKETGKGFSFFGLGGEKLKSQGVDLYYDLTKVAVVGFFEVLKNICKFKKIFNGILKEAEKNKPDAALLVDYPGFNLRLAKELKKRSIPVIYYISPQVWAWGKNRIRQIRENVDRMIVLFSFEEELYRKSGVPVSFVGHPLLDVVRPSLEREEFLKKSGLDPKKLTVALLPGSREKEVRVLLPVMLETAGIINGYFQNRIQFLILRSPSVKVEIFQKAIATHTDLPLKTVSGMAYEGIASSDFAFVCSGTATLETGILATPMAILYKVNFLTWLFIRSMIKIPYIGLVNVVKGRKIVEEFIQFDCRPKKIADYAIPVLHDEEKRTRLKSDLLSIKNSLGESGACRRAAEVVVDFLRHIS